LIAMDDPGLWVGEVYRWAIAALFFIICRSVLRDWASIRVVVWAMVAATLGTWSYALGQVVAGTGPEGELQNGWVRVWAEFGTPNPLAAYIEFTIPVLLILAILGLRSSFRRHLGEALWMMCGITSVMGMVILALTQSRGGMIGFSLAMVVVLWALPARLRLGTIAAGVLLVGILVVTPAGQSQLHRFSKVFESSEPSATGRIDDRGFGRASLWVAGIRMFEAHPWTGIGAGEYDYHYREFTPVWYDRFPRGQAHNGWLQMAAQAGVAGVVAFTGWVVASLVALISALRRSTEPIARALALGALAIMFAFVAHSLVDYLNVLSLGLQISAVTAIGLNLAPDPLMAYRQQDLPDVSSRGVFRTEIA
ncbi:MAG TPA: O-antigen ligase family protein, partial [Thermomicrobiales bacterium]|nr:O-antigen ligase family protein [Thermomicrobiales bacterium]